LNTPPHGPLKVSFYILAYNHQSMIEEAIQGALSQTYQPLEIIVSDDCSDDNTWQIIQQTLADYTGPHRILARRNERNLGISEHVNEVWKHCNGDWIVASAGDDISKPDRVARIMDIVGTRQDIKLVQSWIDEVDANGQLIEVNHLGSHHHPGVLTVYGLHDRIRGASYAPHGAAMAYSRDVVERFPPLPPGVIFEDNIVNLRAELLGSAAVVALPLVKHRNHAGQITQSTRGQTPIRQHERLRARLESDIRSTLQNVSDIEFLSERIPDETRHEAQAFFSRRLKYFRGKHHALVSAWPGRLKYLPATIVKRDVAPLTRDDLMRSLLPDSLYRWIKIRRDNRDIKRSVD